MFFPKLNTHTFFYILSAFLKSTFKQSVKKTPHTHTQLLCNKIFVAQCYSEDTNTLVPHSWTGIRHVEVSFDS